MAFDPEYTKLPGLFRLWDLQLVIDRRDEWHVHYAEPAADGTPLFAVYRRVLAASGEGVA